METEYEVKVRQWFHCALTEKEGQALVGHIAGTKRYGLLVPYNDLPLQAKWLLRAEYEHVKEVAAKYDMNAETRKAL